MTEEELNRFALVLRECDRIRAMITENENSAGGLLLAEPPAVEETSESTVVAAV
jgi:hypothetical protein